MDCQGQRRATEGSQRTGAALDRLNTLRIPFDGSLMGTDALVVALLGPGRLGETHLAALARLRERGVVVDGRAVAIIPVQHGVIQNMRFNG